MIKLKYKNDTFRMSFDVENEIIKFISGKDKITCKNDNEFNWVDSFLELAIHDIENYLYTDNFILYYGEDHYMILTTLKKEELEKAEETTNLKFILIFDKEVLKELYKVLKAFKYFIETKDILKPKYSVTITNCNKDPEEIKKIQKGFEEVANILPLKSNEMVSSSSILTNDLAKSILNSITYDFDMDSIIKKIKDKY